MLMVTVVFTMVIPRSAAQDLPRVKHGSFWFPAVNEVPFERARFPIVLEPDSKTRTGRYISIPLQRITAKGCSVTLKVIVEELDNIPPPDPDNRYEAGARKRHVFITMQSAKTGTPSGFCVSSRKLPVGRVFDTSLNYSSKPPERFYFTMHVHYWVKKVTIVGIDVKGVKMIEPIPEVTVDQETRISQWIEKLSAEEFATRTIAYQSLVDMGPGAIPRIQLYYDDPDPERRMRVRQVIAEIKRNQSKRMPPVKMAK